jgi:hypothetical protein
MVIAEKPYGPNVSVTNLQSIGYVQKRMGVKLRRLVKGKIGTRVHDDKTFCGKVLLTNFEVHKLQNYYALAIRWNVNNLEAMKRAVWTIFITSCQYLRNPNLVCAQMVMRVGVNLRTVPFRTCI